MSDEKWFVEHFDSAGTAFGLRLKARLEAVQTEYQHIEMWDTDTFGYLMTIDGATMVTSRDNFLYHEMMSHPVLFSHPDPKRVVIIGGGDCGTLREVLRHPGVEQATQIDIDEMVTRLSEKYFPELCESNNDPRAELLFIDGVKWMRECDAGSIDVIIVDSTDPVGPAEGLFKADFFRDCHRVLRDGGIIVQQSESPLLHSVSIIRDLHVNMREAGFTSTQTLPFPQPCYPSGWWSCTMAGKGTDVTRFREKDAAAKPFETQYYTADIHRGALTLPPFMKKALS
ncbi:spermidine synthase [Isoalcanivorax pacificus W11-5]|uniref:Polyamine aminopropyltransferase n=1 Tax=Isoalcanivorax pacificus W11-5 TaxID=391936 RepID=A0A0B4XU37_9GAMM|nr:polyamine aminopropyltransferase [Isoalcanivorax pacificus]AJD49797.1 spermidine synthase [Isoalcanivorax pacificus W11-5]